jgi:hypothetical protein
MSTETENGAQSPTTRSAAAQPPEATEPPTTPCTVVWSQGRPYVLESGVGNPRWMGTDTRGRPLALTGADLRRRGWSYRRAS